MNGMEQQDRIRQIKELTSRIMHLHYCENDVERVIASFAPEISWLGAGEGQYAVGRDAVSDFFRRFRNAIPKCRIWEEQYDVLTPGTDVFLCSGIMWIETDENVQMYVKAHQRVTFVYRWDGETPLCTHIHCSNPYMDQGADELFPDKIGKQSYEFVQQHIKSLEKEMEQKNRQLSVIMACIPGGLKISRDDDDYTYQYISKEAAALFGYSIEEFMEATGGTALGAVYPPDRPKAIAGCAKSFQNGGIEYVEKYRVLCKDGSLKWILDSGRKSKDEDGNTLINSLYLDITKSELDAQEIRRQQEQLNREQEHLQEEEKAKKALQEAFEAARQASFAKSDFLSRMSHDIRTPMNAVMGMLSIAEKNLTDPDKLGDCLTKIRLSSEHLLSLINEVLDMSKIESGNVGLSEVPFYLRETLEATVEMIRQESEEKNQHLTMKSGQLVHEEVGGDMVRVQQIFLNLLTNAVKYTPEGGHIRAEVKELLSSVGGVGCFQILVVDDGIGMSEDFKKKIFQPFERAEDSRVSKVQGTGLGMSITQNLVRMMNGSIEVKSRINEGSRITVTIYLKLLNGKEQPKPQKMVSEQLVTASRHLKLLLAEDNDLNREIAKELLEMEKIRVEEAVNGKEAVELFSRSPQGYYDLILMDIQMPVMNGYEAARMIRELKRPDASDIPIVALTANAFADDIYQAKQAGMNAHLAKPLDMQQVMSAIREWVK